MVRRFPLFLILLFVIQISLSHRISTQFNFPFPPFTQLVWDISEEFKSLTSYDTPLGSAGGFRDFSGLLFGMRRLTADVAWLSVLQYYGAHEAEEQEERHPDFGGGHYPSLKKMVLRVVRLDPSLNYAYLYGSGALAFNLDRSQEAIEILQEGIHNQPHYWRFQLYLGAILYKSKGEFDPMIRELETAIRAPDCPTMLKSILANIYKSRKNYKKALEIWIEVGNTTKDPVYWDQSKRQIADLQSKLGLGI